MDIDALAVTLTLVILNAASAVALERSPSREYRIGAPDSPGMYPLIEPAAGWRRFWRPVCLYATIATGVALAIVPILMH